MARASYVSFHYARDHWRVQQILRMGSLDSQAQLPSQQWETVKRRGDAAVKAWIDDQMKYKQAVVVLVGNQTAHREWVKYEISHAWSIGKPMLGIRIHGLKDSGGTTDQPGPNPFASFGFSNSSRTFADYVPLFDPARFTGKPFPSSADIYQAISRNITDWASQGYTE